MKKFFRWLGKWLFEKAPKFTALSCYKRLSRLFRQMLIIIFRNAIFALRKSKMNSLINIRVNFYGSFGF